MIYVLKDLTINTIARTVHREGKAVNMPDLSFDVLVKLVVSAPNAVSPAVLCTEVWHAEHVSDETIAQRITLLRKSIADNAKDPQYIRTSRGQGYAVVGIVKITKSQPVHNFASAFRRKNIIATAFGVLVLFALSIAVLNKQSLAPARIETTPETSQKSDIAILIDSAQAQLKLHQSRETDRAIAMLREALSMESDNFDARMTLSFALSTKTTKFGDDANLEREAEAIARSLIDEQPNNSNAWSALAYSLGSQGRLDESLSAYQYAYQLNPQNTAAISSAAHTQLIRGELYQALLLEAQAMQTGGHSRYAEVQIAQSLELIGHPAFQKWYEKALFLNPNQIVILSVLAQSHLRQGNPDAALQILTQAEGADQSAPQILQLHGRAHAVLGNIDEARVFLEAAGNGAYFDVIALNAHAGNVTQAEALLISDKMEAVEASPSADERIHLAEITAALGQNSKAIGFLSQAVNLGWRDINWLKQSPYLNAVMTSSEGQQIEGRITRELDIQRKLIEGSEKLKAIIAS